MPGSKDRRVHRRDLVAYMRANNIPVEMLLANGDVHVWLLDNEEAVYPRIVEAVLACTCKTIHITHMHEGAVNFMLGADPPDVIVFNYDLHSDPRFIKPLIRNAGDAGAKLIVTCVEMPQTTRTLIESINGIVLDLST